MSSYHWHSHNGKQTHPFTTSVSSVMSESTPALESSLASSCPKQHWTCGSKPRATSTGSRDGPWDSSFTPRRPVGAVPELFVTFRHVSLAIDVPVPPAAATAQGASSRETLAVKHLPTLPNHVRGIFETLSARKTFVHRQILKNVTGVFTPGSMTLLLGRSGSGKSMLLKLLSGRFNGQGKRVTLDGEVLYNGLSRDELKAQLPQCVAYVPQQDTHLSVMSVKETLEFAFECCAIKADATLVGAAVYKSPASECPLVLPTTYLGGERDPVMVTRELGLTRCQGTIVGDDRLRGVSGGEKKRVSIGEMAFGPHAVVLMDEITTGLDSAAAFDVVNAQCRLAKQQRQTVVISLQQPAPEVLALFDNVLLLAEGEVLYHGPLVHIQAYFEALGFLCPPERDLGDFLCDLASPEQILYEKSHAPMPGRRRHPRSANEFADLWLMSPMYERMVEELDIRDNDTETYSQMHSKNGERGLDFDQEALLQVPAFRQSYWRSTGTVMKRQMRLFARNRVYYLGRLLLDVLVGLMIGSVYYGINLADVQVTLGVIFSCALFLGLGQSAALASFFDARKVFYKHRGANFYRTSSYLLASCASQVPLAMTEALVFGSLVYWMGGFLATMEHFLVFVLYMALTVLVFVGAYFFLATACSTLHVAQSVSTLFLLFFILFAGFAVSREQLPQAVRWIYWSNPLAWSTRGILVSQYRSKELDVCEYGGMDYCNMYQGQTLGEYALKLYDVPDDPKWVMLGLFYLATMYLTTMCLSYLMLEHCHHEATPVLPLPSSSLTPVLTPRQRKESYAMLDTPHGDEGEVLESSDLTGFRLVGDEVVVLGEDDDLNDSFNASQGLQTNPEDVAVHLTLGWDVPPITLAFQDIRYSIVVPTEAAADLAAQSGADGVLSRPAAVARRANVNNSKGTMTRELLKGVTGYALPGTMTALMGSTGAGKTTLLDVLAGRKRGKRGSSNLKNGAPLLRGRVLLNGVDATELAVRRCTGYCEQTDVHSDAATFREALQFSAYLRQGDRVAPERIEEFVDECLELLNLNDVAGQIVRGSSSEQLRRLTLGVELAAQPSVLFLDEPTSGLDARAAKALMEGVRKVANAGCTIVCTIHQPSTEVFLLFERLLLLQRGGETVYFGELGLHGETLVKYFQDLSVPCRTPVFKPGDNPATWMLDVIGAGVEKIKPMPSRAWPCRRPARAPLKTSQFQHLDGSFNSSVGSELFKQQHEENVDFVASYKASRLKHRLDVKRAVPGVFLPSDRLPSITLARRQAARDWVQFVMLMRRFSRLYWRTPLYTFTRMVTALTLGFVFGVVYSGTNDLTTYQGANGAVGLIFFSTCFLGVGAYVDVLPLAFNERGPFYRERASETYSTLWYFAASSVVEVPYAAAASLIFLSVFYPMAGFSAHGDFAQVVVYWLMLTVHILFQTYLGQFFTFAMSTIELAAVWGGFLDSLFLMFMGYNPPVSSIPDGYKWLSLLVPHRYTFKVLVALILGDCREEQLAQIAQAAATNMTIDISHWPLGCQRLSDAPLAVSNIPLTLYVDEVFGARRKDITGSVAVVVGIVLMMRLATLIVMRLVKHQKR